MPLTKSLRGLHVLIAEDHRDSREIMQLMLESYGAVVTAVDGAGPALAVIERERVDCLVSDISMAERDGLWLIAQVRARDGERPLPAVAVTARVDRQHRLEILAAGFHVHLPKPVEGEHLLDAIMHAIAHVRQGAKPRWHGGC
jgi:CheY-like chemotaxis protein